jgi:predicted transcriptional regulator
MYNERMHSSDPKKMLQRQVNIRLSDDLFKLISEKAEAVTSSVSQIIREAVILYLEARKK